MAAYAALASLMHVIEQFQHHPCPPISLDKLQVESLTKKVAFLQDFLEGYSHLAGYRNESEHVESRIAAAAYAAEDVIESLIVNQIHDGSMDHGERICYEHLQKMKEYMDFVVAEVMGVQDQVRRSHSISAGSIRNPTMVEFGEVFDKVIDKLIAQRSNLEIIPIVGMGGIGKMTLARNIYEYRLAVHHFDVSAWVTVYQEYSVCEILLELICCVGKNEGKGNLVQLDESELGERLHRSLFGRRYFIVMDDIWSIELWSKVRIFFPDNNNGSRIVITTRLMNLASEVSGSQSRGFQMDFLDESKSWDLLRKSVFGEESCPFELEKIGMRIARNCKGLPLSIVVIGGLLRKSEMTQEYWEYIAENLNSIVNSEDDQILYMSYYQLPVHLKPCFLYLGVFAEDRIVRVSELVKLWVAEGFLKPIGGKSLEEAAEEFVKELIDRNLVLVHKLGWSGKIKSCKVHDLLRDLCLKEADKEKFLAIIMQQNLNAPQGRFSRRHISIHQCASVEKYHSRDSHASLARSLIWDFNSRQYELLNRSLQWNFEEDMFKIILSSGKLRLLRVFKLDGRFPSAGQAGYSKHFKDGIFQLFNLRYLSYPDIGPSLPSSISRLWNLHTLIARGTSATAPPEIWKMPLLKHVEFCNIDLPDPPSGDGFVLGNLQTLFRIRIWDCRENVVQRIPSVKKLKICQGEFERLSVDFLNNLGPLQKLESLSCFFTEKGILQNLTFPHSLKKLTLYGCHLHWEDMTTKIGSLPLLEVLKLERNSFIGPRWETVEGDFCSLKFLLISGFCDLKYWETESSHFPRLEHLCLYYLKELKKIPSGIGEIPTLLSIEVVNCTSSAVISAKQILEEQEERGNTALRVLEVSSLDDKLLKRLKLRGSKIVLKELIELEIMAAYAALVSLGHIIDQIEHHPRPPISLDEQQVESLVEKVTFLQEFLEGYSSHVGYSTEADALEMRIAGAAYAVEYVIESHIVNQIHNEKMSSVEFHEGLQKVIEDMALIKKEVMEMTKKNLGVQVQLHTNLSISADSQRSHSMGRSTTATSSDDVLNEVMDKLTGQPI